jgi:hypothetical protein
VCCDAENIGVDIAAFHWAADMYSRNAIGSVIAVDDVTSTPGTTTSESTSLFVDMLASHSSEINTRIIRIYNVFGESQPPGQGIITRIVHDVTARKPVLDIPVNHCGGYIYVTDAARAVFSVVMESDETASINSDTTTVVERSDRSLVVIRNELLVATSVILAEILSVAPPDYVPDVTSSFFDSDPSSLCSIKSGTSTTSSYLQIEVSTPSPSPSLSATLQWITSKLACRSLRDGIQETIMKSTLHDTEDMNGSNKKKVYSSVQCTAGHQTFPEDWHFYEDDYYSIDNRVCMFENICLLDKRLVYFQHEAETDAPDYAKLSFQNNIFLRLGGLYDIDLQIDVAPKQHIDFDKFEYIDDGAWFFSLSSFSFNYGHLMLDDLYSAVAAIDVFDIHRKESHLIYYGCERFAQSDYAQSAQRNNSYNLDEMGSLDWLCRKNYETISELVFGQPAVELSRLDDRNVCFKKLIMGHTNIFRLYVVDKQRAVTMRKGRDMLLNNLGLHRNLLPQSLSIIILPKMNGEAKPLWPDMCIDVTRTIRDVLLLNDIPIRCFPYDKRRTVKEEIFLTQQATFFIAEHGTVSYLPLLYANDGAVLLSVGHKDFIKDGEVMLYASHLQVFYETVDNKENIAAVIRLCLHRAAQRFNIKFEI